MNKYKCLLIEEDKMVASLISFRLRKLHFDVHQCSPTNTKDIASLNSDIVLFGLHTGTFKGVESIEAVRKAIGKKIPMVIILSNKQQLQVIHNNQLQVEGCINSPIDLLELEQLITGILQENKTENKILS